MFKFLIIIFISILNVCSVYAAVPDEIFTFTPLAGGQKSSYAYSNKKDGDFGTSFDLDTSTAKFLDLAKELNDTKDRAKKQLLLQRIKDEVVKPFVEKTMNQSEFKIEYSYSWDGKRYIFAGEAIRRVVNSMGWLNQDPEIQLFSCYVQFPQRDMDAWEIAMSSHLFTGQNSIIGYAKHWKINPLTRAAREKAIIRGNAYQETKQADEAFHKRKDIARAIVHYRNAMETAKNKQDLGDYVHAANFWASMIHHHRIGGTIDDALKIWDEAWTYAPDQFVSFDQPLAYHLGKRDLANAELSYLNSIAKFGKSKKKIAQTAYAVLSIGYASLLREQGRISEMEAVLAPIHTALQTLTGLHGEEWTDLFDLVSRCHDRVGFDELQRKVDQLHPTNRPVVLTVLSFLTVLVEKDDYRPESLDLMLKAVGGRSEEELSGLNLLLNPLDGWKDFNPFYREPYGISPRLRHVDFSLEDLVRHHGLKKVKKYFKGRGLLESRTV